MTGAFRMTGAFSTVKRLARRGVRNHVAPVKHEHRWRRSGSRLNAAAPQIAAYEASADVATETGTRFSLACPICQKPELEVRRSAGATTSSRLRCDRCSRTYASNSTFTDLTLTSGFEGSNYEEQSWGGTELFRSGVVSAIYERGWRQGFSWAGFPGADVEFGYAMEYLRSHYGGTLVDMSCGSGIFTRRFVASGKFERVIAADFSERMLMQTQQLMQREGLVATDNVLLVRADVARMPFETSSIDAMHAGAALHCWPNPSNALAEISRVLKPGGTFVGSTFLDGTAPIGQLLGDDLLVAPLKNFDLTTTSVRRQYRWWSEPEIKDLFASVGLTNFKRQRANRFILWSVQKPGAADSTL